MVRFAPVPDLGAGEKLVYTIRVRADQPGEFPIQADVKSLYQPQGTTAQDKIVVTSE
jgi:hypothetical protein